MDLGGIDTRRYFAGIALFLAVLFTVLGPEGSVESSAVLRFIQWLLQVSVPLATLIAVHLLLSKSTAFDRLDPWLKLSVSGLVGGLLFAPFALALDFVFGVDTWPGFDDSERLFALVVNEALGVVPPVLLVWLGINAPRVLRLDFSGAGLEPAPPGPQPPPVAGGSPARAVERVPGFFAQLPAAIGRDVVYLMAELHYLRVVTTGGKALVLYNLRDAIDELPADSGIQTHRSFWVAFTHIEKVVTRDGRTVLSMHDGSEVPVSRRQASRVKGELASRLR
jgi:hypothetical protein